MQQTCAGPPRAAPRGTEGTADGQTPAPGASPVGEAGRGLCPDPGTLGRAQCQLQLSWPNGAAASPLDLMCFHQHEGLSHVFHVSYKPRISLRPQARSLRF